MAAERTDTTSVWSMVDITAFWETLKLRWWVIPAVIAVAVGLLWAQESDLRTEPSSYFVSRSYEARDPSAVLASVGLDPVSVRSFPDANNQLLILQSAAVRDEISLETGIEATVSVTRSRPSFSLIDTLESDGQSSFVFQSAGVPTYTFSCREAVKSSCVAAIDAYVAKASEIRGQSLTRGLNDLKAVLTSVQRTVDDPTLLTKVAAIDVLLERSETPLVEITTYEESIGATIASVRRPTYTFAVAAGLFIALLILLQLTYSDSRIRSFRQLLRSIGSPLVLGQLYRDPDAIADRRVAVALRHALQQTGTSTVRVLPLRTDVSNSHALERLATLCGTTLQVSAPVAELTIAGLIESSDTELDVLVAQRNRDLRKDLAETIAALQRSGRHVAGVLLID